MTKKIKALLCAGFGQVFLLLSCSTKISPFISAASKSTAKSRINADRICFPAIGGTKNRGSAWSGMCNWRGERLVDRFTTTAAGRSREFTTNHRHDSTSLMSYVELHAGSAFSFLRGGSFPEQLAEVAAELEMPALALLDRNGVDRKSTRLNSSHGYLSY